MMHALKKQHQNSQQLKKERITKTMPFYCHNVLVLCLRDLCGMASEHIKNSKFVYSASHTCFKYMAISTVLFPRAIFNLQCVCTKVLMIIYVNIIDYSKDVQRKDIQNKIHSTRETKLLMCKEFC